MKKLCFGLIFLLTIGVFLMPMEMVQEVVEEDINEYEEIFEDLKENETVWEVIENMTIYGYKKESDVGSDYYPINTHLCIEYSTSIYFVPFQNTLTIYKLNTSTGAISLIVTEAGSITTFYHDRANDKLYYYYNQANFSYVDLTNDSITDLTPTLDGCEDIFVYDGDLFAVDTSEDDLTFYIYNAGGPSWDAVGTIAEGATNFFDIGGLGDNDNLLGICWDGTYFYIIDDTDLKVYKYNAALDTEIANYALNVANDKPVDICWDGTYFYVTDGADGDIFQYDSSFTYQATFDLDTLSGNLNTHVTGVEYVSGVFYVTDSIDNDVYMYSSTFTVYDGVKDISGLIGGATIQGITHDGTYFFILDVSNDVIFKFNNALDTLIATFDIGALGGNDNPRGLTWDGNYFYVTDAADVGVYKYHSDLRTELGSMLYTAIISNNAYVVYQYIGEAPIIYVKDLDDSSNPSALETLDATLLIPYLENQRGISVSTDNDTLFFVMKDTDDELTYLCTYVISTDVFEQKSEYNIALGLNRNTDSTANSPFSLEKAFGVETGVNDLMVYQISSKRGNLYKIADLTNITALSGYVIVAITDTFLFVYNIVTGGVELWKFQDIGDFILDSEFNWAERYFPAGEITYNSLGYYLEQDMFVQVIKEVASGGSTTTAVAFEGYVRKVEDFDESSTQVKVATLVSPAFDDLINYSPEGEFDGRSDQHIVSMLEGADYITEGTLSNGRALSTVKYKGEKFLKAYLDEFGAGDSFTWRLRATGELDYNNNTTDSGVDYSNSVAPKIFDIKVSSRDIRYNKIIVKGGIVNGIQLVSTDGIAENTDEQAVHGVIATEITIAHINTQALADAWAVALLGLLGSVQTYVEFSVLDTTNEVVAPGETITFEDTTKGVSSAQFKVNQVTFKGKSTRITTYVISSALRYEIADFEATLPLQNSQLIAQNTELIANIAGDLTLFLHEEASSDIAGYLQLLQATPDDAKNTITDTITTVDQEVEQWATEPGIPGVVVLDEFISVIHVHAWKSAGIKNIQIYFKLYSRAIGGAETLVATSETSAIIPSTEVHQAIHMFIPEVVIDATDRLVLKLFASPTGFGSNPELSFAIEGITVARIELQVPALIPSDLNAHITTSEEYFAIGVANKRYIFCPFGGGSPSGSFLYSGGNLGNVGATDYNVSYEVPLPATLGSKKLYIDAIRVGVQDADADDYLDRVRLMSWDDYATVTTHEDDGTNRTTPEDYTYTFTAVDVSAGKHIFVRLDMFATGAGHGNISYVEIEYYYDD